VSSTKESSDDAAKLGLEKKPQGASAGG